MVSLYSYYYLFYRKKKALNKIEKIIYENLRLTSMHVQSRVLNPCVQSTLPLRLNRLLLTLAGLSAHGSVKILHFHQEIY